ncbi:hypothetical protein DPEC_G00043110 [Dallia pectoralis]|uniref:Uncharacterized protein n=1 Tax=Dallia pectoralis TaxID=75939 RepID=A0ACC2H998_DALPE|nr:hypothetical protein DPEC_G00043110 [Dallia pectoralis]
MWTWFGFKASDEQQTNLFYHLKIKHVTEYQHCQEMQPTSSPKNAGQKKQERSPYLRSFVTEATQYSGALLAGLNLGSSWSFVLSKVKIGEREFIRWKKMIPPQLRHTVNEL